MHTLTNSGGQNADHTLVPRGIVERHCKQRGIILQINEFQLCQRILLHGLLNIPSLPIELVQFFGEASRRCKGLCQQAFYPDRHIVETTRRIQPGANNETEVTRRRLPVVTPCHLK